ncbi:Transmembrane protein [Senna tora]|uniref:Transmembrane protein n=1 Tax=Senna tora TaxID=362788 RepID=A0A834T5F6_9FABA|nr:Transmembrane protein [Senna tora]
MLEVRCFLENNDDEKMHHPKHKFVFSCQHGIPEVVEFDSKNVCMFYASGSGINSRIEEMKGIYENDPKLSFEFSTPIYDQNMADECKNLTHLPSSFVDLQSLILLDIRECKKLEHLPMLPPSIKKVWAALCTLLKTVQLDPLHRNTTDLRFENCMELDEDSCKVVELTGRRSLTNFASKPSEEQGQSLKMDDAMQPRVIYPGSKIPRWFKYRTSHGSVTMTIAPPPSKFRGFIFCMILTNWDNFFVGCLLENHGECSELINQKVEESKGGELTFIFSNYDYDRYGNQRIKVIRKCGVCPIYATQEVEDGDFEEEEDEDSEYTGDENELDEAEGSASNGMEEDKDPWLAPDKVYHLLFCFFLTILFSFLATLTRHPFLRRHSIPVGSICSLLAGAAKEAADEFGYFPSAGASARDAVADVVGVLIASFALSVFRCSTRSDPEMVEVYYGGKLVIEPTFMYVGRCTSCWDKYDIDRWSYWEIVDYLKELGLWILESCGLSLVEFP